MDMVNIVSELNNLVLDIAGGSTEAGAKLITWNYHGGPNQRFYVNEKGFIVSAHSGMVLDAEGGAAQGNKIIQYYAHGGPNQLWRFHKDGSIRLVGSNLCFDIAGNNQSPGAEVIAYDFHAAPNQKWRLVQVYDS